MQLALCVRFARSLRFLAIALLVVLASVHAERAAADVDWSTIEPSIVVVGYAKGGVFESYGTAFCVKSDATTSTFLTADHVVHPKSAPLAGYSLVILTPNSRTPIPASDAQLPHSSAVDLAEVSVRVGQIPAMTISPRAARTRDPIVAAGYPYVVGSQLFRGETGITSSALDGRVTNASLKGNLLIAYAVVGGAVDRGASGGPLVDPQTGNVYGVIHSFVPGSPIQVLTAGERAQVGLPQAPPSANLLSASYTSIAIARDVVVAFLNPGTQPLPSSVAIGGEEITGATAVDAVLQSTAAQGDAVAQNTLGMMYQYGSYVAQDYTQARRYFQLAAAQGDADAQNNLGVLDQYGLGGPKNLAAALRAFQAAARGSAKAEANLGYLYANGIGVERNDVLAFQAFQRSAAQGDALGESNLGWMYDPRRNSQGVPADPAQAEKYYRLAAKQIADTGFYSLAGVQQGFSARLIAVERNPQWAAMTPNGREVYVTNLDSNSVSVIDTTTNTVTHTLQVGTNPWVVVMGPDGRHAYVANNNGGSISVIDTATKSSELIRTDSPSVRDIAITPDGRRLFLAMEYAGLEVVDLPSGTVEKISSVMCPEGLAIMRNGKRLYVSYQCTGPGGRPGHDAVGVYDLDPGKPCRRTDTSGCAFSGAITGFPNVGGKLALSPDGSQLWLNGSDACSQPAYDHAGCAMVPGSVINVIDTRTNTALRTIVFRPEEGNGPFAFVPNGNAVLIGGGTLLKRMDWRRMTFLQPLPVGSGGLAAFTPDGSRAYQPVPGQNAVAVIAVR